MSEDPLAKAWDRYDDLLKYGESTDIVEEAQRDIYALVLSGTVVCFNCAKPLATHQDCGEFG